MFKISLLALVVTTLTVLPATAENWVLVTRSRDGTDYFIDTESVQENHETRLFWRMSVNPKPDEQGIVVQKTYISMSCPLRSWRRKAIANFNTVGELISREEFNDTEPLQFFTPGSVGESLWKFVCN